VILSSSYSIRKFIIKTLQVSSFPKSLSNTILALVEMNKEVISSMYPEMYGTEKNPLPAIMASATSGDPNSKAVLPKQLDAKGYQPDTYKRFQDVISRMRNKGKAAEHGLFFKHIIDIIKYKHAKGPHFGKVLRAVDRRRDEKAWMPPSGVPMRMTKKLYDSVARKELEGRARFMGNRPSIDRRNGLIFEICQMLLKTYQNINHYKTAKSTESNS
jgi:hypothetical protein